MDERVTPDFSGAHEPFWMFVYACHETGSWTVLGGKIYEWGKSSEDGPPVLRGEIAIPSCRFRSPVAMSGHDAALIGAA